MPSVSGKQARFMSIAAHSPEFARKAGIRQSVAKEYNRRDEAMGKIVAKRNRRLRKSGY